jgi:dTDP-4-amino-4,6-dideoxygalactose transaminase
MKIPFNKSYISGKELDYIKEVFLSGKLSGDGKFTDKCQNYLENKYGFKKCFLTTSCTDALEMSAILLDIKPGDEVIMPSFTFVSTANAFALRGAKIVFADCKSDIPNIDPKEINKLINKKTKAVVIIHYAGISSDMNDITKITEENNITLVEDAALGLDSRYKGVPLGTFGDLSTFSFHETKNIICGEGGVLAINNKQYIKRAEIIREKGTNRSEFLRGEVGKYGWVDIGSSFLPSEIIAGFLYAQLENLDKIQSKRKYIWYKYFNLLKPLEQEGCIKLPHIPEKIDINGQIFYFTCKSLSERNNLIEFLKEKGITATFHYLPLHNSEYYKNVHGKRKLLNTIKFSECLIRLPIFFELKDEEIEYITSAINNFYKKK